MYIIYYCLDFKVCYLHKIIYLLFHCQASWMLELAACGVHTTFFVVFSPEDANRRSSKGVHAYPGFLGALLTKGMRCLRHAVCGCSCLAGQSSLGGYRKNLLAVFNHYPHRNANLHGISASVSAGRLFYSTFPPKSIPLGCKELLCCRLFSSTAEKLMQQPWMTDNFP